MIISGKATAQKTQQLAARHPGLVYNLLGGQSAGPTGLVVSQAGFGSYRIEAGNETHQEALRHALLAQFTWALYRGFALTVVPEPAQAAIVALALISLPWFLDPQRRYDLFTLRGYLVVQDWLLALGTVLLALAANVLWFLLLMHTLWVWGGSQVLVHLSASRVRDAQTRAAQ